MNMIENSLELTAHKWALLVNLYSDVEMHYIASYKAI